MPLDFPTPLSLNQVYSLGGKSWKWNGAAWETYNGNVGITGPTGEMPTDYVSSFNGITGAVQGVSSWNGQTGAVQFHNYVSSFNGTTGAVEGVSAVNGVTGGFTIRSGMGITHSVSNNGISLEINYIRGGQPFPTLIGASGKALMAQDNLMLLSFKNSGASAGFMYTTRVQDFLEKFVGARVVEPLGEDPSTASFLMVGGGGEGYVDFASMPLVTSVNGKTGPIGFVAQQGITLSVSGITTSISLNYLQGASAMVGDKYPSRLDWIAIQKYTSPNLMQRTQIGNISYLFLGTQGTKGSGNFFRMATDIDEGEGTATDQYVSFSAIADEILNQIDGGTFA